MYSKKRTNPPILGFPTIKSVKACVCRVDFSSSSQPSLPVPPGASVLHQGASSASEEKLSGVREVLFAVAMHTRGCAVAFSHQIWLVSIMIVALHAFFLFFAGH